MLTGNTSIIEASWGAPTHQACDCWDVVRRHDQTVCFTYSGQTGLNPVWLPTLTWTTLTTTRGLVGPNSMSLLSSQPTWRRENQVRLVSSRTPVGNSNLGHDTAIKFNAMYHINTKCVWVISKRKRIRELIQNLCPDVYELYHLSNAQLGHSWRKYCDQSTIKRLSSQMLRLTP